MERKLCRIITLPLSAFLLLLLAACATQDTPTLTPTLAPTATLDVSMGMGEAGEAWNLLAQRGAQVWAGSRQHPLGWGQSLPPLLIRNGSDDFLVGHPHPP